MGKKSYSTCGDDYKLLEEVGYGASATVYRAIYLPSNEVIAVKCLDLDRCNSNLDSPSNEREKAKMSRVPYSLAVGSLMFAMVCTSSDIAQAVGVVSRYMSNPGEAHWGVVKWVLRYLKGTSNAALCYSGSDVQLVGFVDLDWAGDRDKRKSTTGYVFCMGYATVSWVSKLQIVVALSTTEAEYMAATQACNEAVWLERLLQELQMKQGKVTTHCDSQSALHLAKNPAYHARTQHIDVQYHYVRELVEEKRILLQKIATEANSADMLTKPIAREKFIWCRTSLGLQVQ